ncbi:uncharacterized protein GIQ15_06886 [Arthroderma uncinatum]|uniref:uncharacterized protein n=1 Tax=Arthroderma uncinatum TaxID=74035 RepID=UPI00144AE233|nr:uncharacterized protein GIQ15_06886 [Arthroderma uncinatum]KAF3479910.1 hypothetical protein GIQ15_06886 [Arthroderma uncinatum]
MRPKLRGKPRCRAKEGPALVFVDNGDLDRETRVAIRQQAARSGCRRRRESYKQREEENIPAVISFNGYETLRARYNFDLTSLSSFTDIDLGRVGFLSLQNQPTPLAALLEKRSSSFLTHLPSRYGSSACLDDAMHCLAARAGKLLGSPIRTTTLFRLYTKALKSLYTALEGHLLDVDIYCATAILALYELLGPADENRWIQHTRGAIKLVALRGPDNHKTEFERMILKIHAPSVLVDEQYRKQSSIFASPSWQRFFDQASEAEEDTHSGFWWEFFGRACAFVPGILKDITALFRDPACPQYKKHSLAILERANRVHAALHDSHGRFQQRAPSLVDLPVGPESPDRVRLRALFIYTTITVCRVLATFARSKVERAASETEAQTLAAGALLIERAVAELDPAMAWHLQQRNALAHVVIQTRDRWVDDVDVDVDRFLAQRWMDLEDAWQARVLTEAFGES